MSGKKEQEDDLDKVFATDIPSVGPKMLTDIIEVAFATPIKGTPGQEDCTWGAVLNIVGEPGLGKTMIASSVGAYMSLDTESIFASQHPPEDFSGALIPDGKGGATQICPLGPVRKLLKGYGVIFLDEVNCASPATMAALQSFINERRAGDEHIGNHVRLIAASNPEELATSGYRFPPAIANRFVHVHYDGGTADEWIEWNTGGGPAEGVVKIDDIENRIAEGWTSEFSKTKGLFNSFLKNNTALLHRRPPVEHPQSSSAWASRRTWDFAQRVWATAMLLGKPDEVRVRMIEGCVGVGASDALIEHHSKVKVPSPEDVLSGKWKIDKDRLDVAFAAYSSLTSYILDTKDKKKQLDICEKGWAAFLEPAKSDIADLVVPCIDMLVNNGLGRKTSQAIEVASRPVFLELSRKGWHKYEVK